MEPQHDDGVALSAFDQQTAAAVVSVLRGAGVSAWLAAGGQDDVEVRVPAGQRDSAMHELGARMEEVQAAVRSARPPPERRSAPAAHTSRSAVPLPDPDDVHAGPPLVMERFRSMKVLAAVVMAPLLVVTLAPTLRGSAARMIVVGLVVVAAVVVAVMRHRR